MVQSKNQSHHIDPSKLQFTVFSADEIRLLSTAKIITGLSFDALGNALPGGLYDPAMGPSSPASDPCSTCMKSFRSCEGHLGHIELQMIVFNPFFLSTVYQLLRVTCLNCYHLQFPENIRQILLLQLQLIDAGYIIEAQEIEILKSTLYNTSTADSEHSSTFVTQVTEYEGLLKSSPINHCNKTKNSESIRSLIINTALREAVTKTCVHCKKPMKKVKKSYGKIVIGISKSEMKAFYGDKETKNNADLVQKAKAASQPIMATLCRTYLRELYKLQSNLLISMFPILKNANPNKSQPIDIFFMEVIPVLPPRVRPTNTVNQMTIEHEHTKIYKHIILMNFQLRAVVDHMKLSGEEDETQMTKQAKDMFEKIKGGDNHEKLYNAWQDLQTAVNSILDGSEAQQGKFVTNVTSGLKQIIEKKTGLIRMNMMGKRVDFAARTVITPDPNINVDEIGVPEIFAKKLSYPVPVTEWNLNDLREMVMNGPNVHPGANYLEHGNGNRVVIPVDNATKRASLAKMLLTPNERGIKIVHRHLLNGDILLLNRQPSLHRPSMQAHKARILKGEKTFRLHYSNCKAYNADFDGDEMNAHYPQNELGRSEAYNLANVANNYLVPKDGTPLGGLIQDHMIAGVRISMRGKFFNREDYHQLVFQGLSHIKGNIKLLPPTILKPVCLWSGKQVFSTIIINLIPDGKTRINLTSTAKIKSTTWKRENPRAWTCGGTPFQGNNMSEAEVIIRGGELCVGVLDKMHYGSTPYCLVHCMYELYGGHCATQLLTSLARCFTVFLQWDGFTLGVRDILVIEKADKKRKKIIEKCRNIGYKVTASVLNMPADSPVELLEEKLNEAYVSNNNFRSLLDRGYKSALNEYTNEINKTCIPGGLITSFPDNNLQLMVESGAKGSTVNTMQISSLLGQIELEGKRPPLMISGKSLPSFTTFETSPKSGGFIDGRFMTGIQPQDFFFHCMAGREGLIDTAVKTSRSGYLQRCLIKHLEGVTVNYDMTVRDSDNSVIQFLYGEDGMDICRSQFLKPKQMEFLFSNEKVIVDQELLKQLEIDSELGERLRKHKKKIRSWLKKNKHILQSKHVSPFQQFSADVRDEISVKKPKKLVKSTGRLKLDTKISKLWLTGEDEKRAEYERKFSRRPDPLLAKFPSNNCFGSISEYLEVLIKCYAQDHPDKKKEIEKMVYVKSLKSLAEPGEPVGLLAAQSIGEPSTQMTLNTFHFAGRGEMNVTLGIPRLREILMVASKNIKTPSMDIPFKPEIKNLAEVAERTRLSMCRVTLADVLETIHVRISLKLQPTRGREYSLRFHFLPRDAYADKFPVKPKQILKYMTSKFFKSMFRAIVKATREKNSIVDVTDDTKEKRRRKKEKDVDQEEDRQIDEQEPEPVSNKAMDPQSSDDEMDKDADLDVDATMKKLKNRQADENEYEESENEEEGNAESDDDDKSDNDDENVNAVDKDGDDELELANEVNNVMASNEFTESYTFDTKHHLWCEVKFNLPMQYRSIDFSTLLKTIAQKSVIAEKPNIKRAITYTHNDQLILKTDGINIIEMFKYNQILDLNRLYTNDIHSVAHRYGIEAARRVIVKEVQNVFGVYGITVDPRHLLLIADYMTFDGTFKALNRTGMESSSSPLQQISFESSLQFLKTATVAGRHDNLESPSSRLMLGQPLKCGTGAFSLLTDFNLLFQKLGGV